MSIDLTSQQEAARAELRALVAREILPHAARFDREEALPVEIFQRLAGERLLGSMLPAHYGGREFDPITYGLLHEELGRGCSSLRTAIIAHDMVAQALLRWGSSSQQERWLPKLTRGNALCAFALTEPDVGSDAKSLETAAVAREDGYRLTGEKKWITSGQTADLFLVFARCHEGVAAFLVEKDRPGFSRRPISGLLGLRAAMLAELHFDECLIPRENLLGAVGFGFSHVAQSALDLGRYCVACGCVGIAQACLDASIRYANEREQFGVKLREHQLIQEMLAEMIVQVEASRLLCRKAGHRRSDGDPRSIMDTSIAKYHASRVAMKAARDAVQIHGANGCSDAYPVARYFRDAKVMEIVEGSSQIHQILIANHGCREYGAPDPSAGALAGKGVDEAS